MWTHHQKIIYIGNNHHAVTEKQGADGAGLTPIDFRSLGKRMYQIRGTSHRKKTLQQETKFSCRDSFYHFRDENVDIALEITLKEIINIIKLMDDTSLLRGHV